MHFTQNSKQTNTVNTQKSPPSACDKGCAEACAERFSALKYVRVYGLYRWGRGDYQKEGRGVSGVSCQVHIFYIGHSQYGQLTAVKTGLPLTSIPWPYRGLMCQLIEVTWFIWKLSADQLIILLDRDQCSVSYFLASLGSEHRKTDTRQCCDPLTAVKTRYPLTSITWLYRGLRCRPIEVKYFLKLSADKVLVFKWSQAQV